VMKESGEIGSAVSGEVANAISDKVSTVISGPCRDVLDSFEADGRGKLLQFHAGYWRSFQGGFIAAAIAFSVSFLALVTRQWILVVPAVLAGGSYYIWFNRNLQRILERRHNPEPLTSPKSAAEIAVVLKDYLPDLDLGISVLNTTEHKFGDRTGIPVGWQLHIDNISNGELVFDLHFNLSY